MGEWADELQGMCCTGLADSMLLARPGNEIDDVSTQIDSQLYARLRTRDVWKSGQILNFCS